LFNEFNSQLHILAFLVPKYVTLLNARIRYNTLYNIRNLQKTHLNSFNYFI